MSGGDHDGDIAWTCWDPQLLEQMKNMFEPHYTSPYVVEKDPAENEVFWKTEMKDHLNYFFHFNSHHENLGMLCEKLDIFIDACGFEHEITQDLGRACFLQVGTNNVCYVENNK